jgi:RES domain-containing protein
VISLPWETRPVEAWRLDALPYAATWDKGIGAAKAGGRWNPIGYPVVYCSADPAIAILEVAVHKGFQTLDTMPHELTSAIIFETSDVYVVQPENVPNPGWLSPVLPGRGQQDFGRQLLEQHPFVLIPSAVSPESWNLLFNPDRAVGRYQTKAQKRFALDTRLNPP